MTRKTFLLLILTFTAGLSLGGFLFIGSKSRSPLTAHECKNNCWHPNEIAGLFASVVVQKIPGLIPDVILETDKTIVFKYPRSAPGIHYLFVPKKDIKNIGELTEDDKDYIIDMYSAVATVIKKQGIKNYRLWTNGPSKQDVTYLHFHLVGEK